MAFTEIEVLEAENALYAVANADDMFRLGLMYSTDMEDSGPNFVEAHKWFSLAAMMGNIPSKAYREELKFEMSAQDLTMAQRAAREWVDEYKALLAA